MKTQIDSYFPKGGFMSFNNESRRRYGGLVIQNLALYVTVIFSIGYLLLRTEFGIRLYVEYLAFFPKQVLSGQVWRILTAIFFPPSNTSNVLLGALSIFIYYNFASAVERSIGEKDYNRYFFGSILAGELGTVLYYLITGDNFWFLPVYTHFSVFMAYAILYSESSVLLFFVIPVKVRWIALFELAAYLFELVNALLSKDLYTVISIISALIPVGVYYLAVQKRRTGENLIGRIRFMEKQRKRRKEWQDQWK